LITGRSNLFIGLILVTFLKKRLNLFLIQRHTITLRKLADV
jgi:hypothetical protein